MTPEQPVPPDLRPLRVGEILDAAFRVLRKNLRAFLTIGAAFRLPMALVTFVYLTSQIESISGGFLFVKNPDSYGSMTTVLAIASRMVELLCFGVLVHLATKLYLNRSATAGTIVRESMARMVPFVGMSILLLLYAILVLFGASLVAIPFGLVGTLFAIVVMIGWATLYSLAAPAFWFERNGATAAIGRSANLVSDRFWSVLGAISVALVIVVIFSVGSGALILGAFTQTDNPVWFVLLTVGGEFLGSLISLLILAPIVTVAYFDIRVRKEGFDMKLKLDEISNPEPPPGPW